MDAILWRMLERIVATLIGGMAIVLGYRLFSLVPAEVSGQADMKLPMDIRLVLSRVGPGVFFALFGAGVVVSSFVFPVELRQTADRGSGRVGFSGFSQAISGDLSSAHWSQTGAPVELRSGTIRSAADRAVLERDRLRARQHLEFLNQLDRWLDPALPEAQKTRIRRENTAAKLRLMRSLWAEDWGSLESFYDWAEGDTSAAPPEESRAAADYYLFGLEGSP